MRNIVKFLFFGVMMSCSPEPELRPLSNAQSYLQRTACPEGQKWNAAIGGCALVVASNSSTVVIQPEIDLEQMKTQCAALKGYEWVNDKCALKLSDIEAQCEALGHRWENEECVVSIEKEQCTKLSTSLVTYSLNAEEKCIAQLADSSVTPKSLCSEIVGYEWNESRAACVGNKALCEQKYYVWYTDTATCRPEKKLATISTKEDVDLLIFPGISIDSVNMKRWFSFKTSTENFKIGVMTKSSSADISIQDSAYFHIEESNNRLTVYSNDVPSFDASSFANKELNFSGWGEDKTYILEVIKNEQTSLYSLNLYVSDGKIKKVYTTSFKSVGASYVFIAGQGIKIESVEVSDLNSFLQDEQNCKENKNVWIDGKCVPLYLNGNQYDSAEKALITYSNTAHIWLDMSYEETEGGKFSFQLPAQLASFNINFGIFQKDKPGTVRSYFNLQKQETNPNQLTLSSFKGSSISADRIKTFDITDFDFTQPITLSFKKMPIADMGSAKTYILSFSAGKQSGSIKLAVPDLEAKIVPYIADKNGDKQISILRQTLVMVSNRKPITNIPMPTQQVPRILMDISLENKEDPNSFYLDIEAFPSSAMDIDTKIADFKSDRSLIRIEKDSSKNPYGFDASAFWETPLLVLPFLGKTTRFYSGTSFTLEIKRSSQVETINKSLDRSSALTDIQKIYYRELLNERQSKDTVNYDLTLFADNLPIVSTRIFTTATDTLSLLLNSEKNFLITSKSLSSLADNMVEVRYSVLNTASPSDPNAIIRTYSSSRGGGNDRAATCSGYVGTSGSEADHTLTSIGTTRDIPLGCACSSGNEITLEPSSNRCHCKYSDNNSIGIVWCASSNKMQVTRRKTTSSSSEKTECSSTEDTLACQFSNDSFQTNLNYKNMTCLNELSTLSGNEKQKKIIQNNKEKASSTVVWCRQKP